VRHYSLTCWEAACIVETDLIYKLWWNMDQTRGAQCVARLLDAH
jgi:hypothetical protein